MAHTREQFEGGDAQAGAAVRHPEWPASFAHAGQDRSELANLRPVRLHIGHAQRGHSPADLMPLSFRYTA